MKLDGGVFEVKRYCGYTRFGDYGASHEYFEVSSLDPALVPHKQGMQGFRFYTAIVATIEFEGRQITMEPHLMHDARWFVFGTAHRVGDIPKLPSGYCRPNRATVYEAQMAGARLIECAASRGNWLVESNNTIVITPSVDEMQISAV